MNVAIAVATGAQAQWSVMADMPVACQTQYAVTLDSVIYVMGGSTTMGPISGMYAYHPSTNTWETKASMLHSTGEFYACAINGKIYAVGGYDGSSTINNVQEYDPSTNTWTAKAPLLTGRSQFSGAVLNIGGSQHIVINGGYPGTFTSTEIYDPIANSWSSGAASPFGMLQVNGGAALNNQLYTIGGKNASNTVVYDSVFTYNALSDSWTTSPHLPMPRFAGATAVMGSKIYYMGGAGTGFVTSDSMFVYDSATSTWGSGPKLLNKRKWGAAAVYNNAIYLFGGADSTGTTIAWTHKFSLSAPPDTPSAINEISKTRSGLIAYPNPAPSHQSVTIRVNAPGTGLATINIYDLTGRLVKVMQCNNEVTWSTEIPGQYIIEAVKGDHKDKTTIIVQ